MKQQLLTFCKSLGLDTVGMIPCRRFHELQGFLQDRQKRNLQNEFEEQDIEKRITPMTYMEDGKTILSIAFPYYYEENNVNTCHNDKPCHEEAEETGFSIYTKRYDYHRVLRKYLDQICAYIEELGGKAIPLVDSNTLPERYIAYLAGIGFIGRNNMIITEKYGSYVFLGEIITDLEFDCQDRRHFEEIVQYAECGDCRICYGVCPSKSINAGKITPNICLSYLTQKKEITDKEISLLKGNVFGCDFCQLKCPYNERAEQSGIKEFAELAYMNEDMKVFAGMDNKFFKEKISMTSCGWRGKNVIKRNALIHLAAKGEDISEFKGDSPYINGYIDRLNEKYQKQEDNNET